MTQIKWFYFILFSIHLAFAKDFTLSTDVFKSNVVQVSPSMIAVQFKIASGYEVYQDKVKINVSPKSKVKIGNMQLPSAILKHNLALGNYMVYSDDFEVLLPITGFADGHLVINVAYQGCKADSYCYPANSYSKTLQLTKDAKLIPKQIVEYDKKTTGFMTFSNDNIKNTTKQIESMPNDSNVISVLNSNNSNAIANVFKGNYFLIILGFLFVGILIAFTPCVFPMLPILLAIIVGKGLNLRKTFTLSSSYILGSACSYAIAGIVVAKFGSSVQSILQNIWVNSVIALMFVIFSLSLFGLFELQLPYFIRKYFMHELDKKHSIIGVFLTGAISTLVLSPCVTAPLAGALLYIGSSGDVVLGGSALFAMGIGSGLPLLLIAIFGNQWLPTNGLWMVRIKHILGFIMLLMGVYLSSRFISNLWTYILASVWLIGLGIFVFRLQKRHDKLFLVSVIIAILIGASGVFLLGKSIKSIMYNSINTLQLQTINITNINELDLALQNAKQQNMPVIIDYTALWCSSCQEMELTTLANQDIVKLLNSKFIVINADISNNNVISKVLMDKYKVFAPPTLVFVDKNGVVDTNDIIVGYISAEKLIPLLEKLN